jgi:ArsR family transcriptional regulator
MRVDILKALSDPTRLLLLQKLSERELCACVLPGMVGKSQPTVSSHLKVLEKVGILSKRKDGAKRLYSLSPTGKKVLHDIERW